MNYPGSKMTGHTQNSPTNAGPTRRRVLNILAPQQDNTEKKSANEDIQDFLKSKNKKLTTIKYSRSRQQYSKGKKKEKSHQFSSRATKES